jgi:hypothetical protein
LKKKLKPGSQVEAELTNQYHRRSSLAEEGSTRTGGCCKEMDVGDEGCGSVWN